VPVEILQPRTRAASIIGEAAGTVMTHPTMEVWCYKGAAGCFEPITHEQLTVDRGDPYTIQLRHLCAVARREKIPQITATDATETLRATIAVLEVARSGARVSLNNE